MEPSCLTLHDQKVVRESQQIVAHCVVHTAKRAVRQVAILRQGPDVAASVHSKQEILCETLSLSATRIHGHQQTGLAHRGPGLPKHEQRLSLREVMQQAEREYVVERMLSERPRLSQIAMKELRPFPVGACTESNISPGLVCPPVANAAGHVFDQRACTTPSIQHPRAGRHPNAVAKKNGQASVHVHQLQKQAIDLRQGQGLVKHPRTPGVSLSACRLTAGHRSSSEKLFRLSLLAG